MSDYLVSCIDIYDPHNPITDIERDIKSKTINQGLEFKSFAFSSFDEFGKPKSAILIYEKPSDVQFYSTEEISRYSKENNNARSYKY